MSETSRGTGLRPQLRERIAAQHQEIEQQTVSELKKLSVSCQESVQHELSTIVTVMAQQSALVRRSFARLLFWIVSLSLALVLSLSLGSWGLGQWLTYSIESHLKQRSALQAEIAAQQATLRQIEQQSWGVGYQETSQGRFLTLPASSAPGWRVGDKPAVRLSPK